MNSENAITVKQVTKKFKVYYDKGHTLKEKVLFGKRRRFEEREVLKGISFEVKKGEAVGLIGSNGCGKSTTLKLLTRIMYPDSGSIQMKGRVSSLIELGAGFHPDMSGRENIYINASIFGLSKKEIEKRIDRIIAFSELEPFIDNPVRTYSSGMYMRLAFAVAINVDADILLIDEILAVGDVAFQAKCFHKLQEIKANGTTIVIVSHSLGQIEQICEKSIWIKDGVVAAEGLPRDIHPQFLDYMGNLSQPTPQPEAAEQPVDETQASSEAEQKMPEETEPEAPEVLPAESEQKRWGNEKARITAIRLLREDKTAGLKFHTGENITVELEYKVNEMVEDAVFGIAVYRIDGVHCYGTNTRLDRVDRFHLEQSGTARLNIEQLPLLPGEYTLDFAIESGYGIPVDYYTRAVKIEVYSDLFDVGVARIPHQWKIES